MRHLIALLAGIVFGAGLAVSGMMNPSRVRGFLDVFGRWDPTLVFVMGGAVIVMSIAWFVQKRLARPVADRAFCLPPTRRIDARLVGGAMLFGIGWGLAGLCPGPAISSLATSIGPAAIFVVSMFAGMGLFRMIEVALARQQA